MPASSRWLLLWLWCITGTLSFVVPTTTRQRTALSVIDWARIEVDAVTAFIGGSAGVLGTLLAYENRRYHARTRVACAYCEGRGSLVCGYCGGVGCEHCHEGRVKCVNCEATGLAIPPQLERKSMQAKDEELETMLDQIGIAALADDILRQEAKPEDMDQFNLLVARRADAIARRAKTKSSSSDA